MALERGTLLNKRYRILEILGQGGMGAIYRALDENLGIEVAVKENLFTTDEFARQFRREALILASLRHPNLPRVTDHFVVEGQGQYLVMDYIEGEDLRERMDRLGTLPDNEVIILGAAICDALTYLHTRKPPIVHRDVKPGNVKVTPNGLITLVDFGLAKVTEMNQATTTGARAMTPGYSPPEQYGTARTDHRTDVFALGATLYVALTGVLPEDALMRAMEQVQLTPIRKRNPKASRRLAMAIEKALELKPDERYQSSEEFKHALLNSRGITERRHPVEATVTPPPEGMATAIHNEELAAMGAAGALPHSPPFTDDPPLLPTSTPFQAWEEPKPRRVSRMGLWLALGLAGVIALAGIGVYTTQPALLDPALSWMATFFSPGKAATQTAALVAQTRIPLTPDTPTPTLSPTPRPTPSATQAPALAKPATPTRSPTPIPTNTPTATTTPMGGGQGQIAFASDITGQPQIWIMNADGTAPRQVTDLPEGACQPDWAPDGFRLVFISPCAFPREAYPGASLFIINEDGTGLVALPTKPGGDFDPSWSPEGERITFTSLRDFGRPQIYIIYLADNTFQNLSNNIWRDYQPVWSPDGLRIAFISTRRGPSQVWTMAVDGSDPVLFSRSGSLKNTYPSWSPDGQVILFTQSEVLRGLPRLVAARYPYNEENYRENPLIPGVTPMREGKYSPDGYWIAFESWPLGANHDIFIMMTNGPARQQLTTDESLEFDPAWRPER